jgi:hypothetical protein
MYPNTNLQPGQTGNEVKKLQDFLVSQNLMSPEDVATGPGIYGPRTTAAVKKFQEQTGVDNTSGPGYWGPKTIAAASGSYSNETKGSGTFTQEDIDRLNAEVAEETKRNPITAPLLAQGNSPESLQYAIESGDFSQLLDYTGQPFSIKDQQKALERAKEDTRAFYEAQKTKETADTEASLAQKQADYQNYLLNSGQQFEADKSTADQQAANRGVLFSGGRVQKEKNLQRSYEQDQAYKQASLGRDITSTAQDYQYKYGDKAAGGLSQYYKLGQNTFNPNVARGGVGSGSLSSVYNPNKFNLGSGSRVKEEFIDNQTRAAKKLWNQGNKLLSTGYTNQY